MFGIYLTIVVSEFYLLYLCMIMNLFNDAKVMRHAFLILAHNEFQILKILLSMLDDGRNDIYLHIDKKVVLGPLEQDLFRLAKARLFVLEQRLDVRWGDISVVKAELLLLETASMKGPYDYYHLLSGVDLPIKSQDYIHHFFEKNKGYEFVPYSCGEANLKDLERKVFKYHLFCRYYKIPPRIFKKQVQSLRISFLKLQDFFHYNRPKEIEFKKGSNWVSITHELLTIILAQKSFILRRFKNVCCGDEIFLQSILWNSERRSHIYPGSEQLNAGLRAIDWERGNPYVWKMEDLQYLLETEHLFARKFDSQNMDVVIKIRELFS